jgi:hypothetical protein
VLHAFACTGATCRCRPGRAAARRSFSGVVLVARLLGDAMSAEDWKALRAICEEKK